MDPGRVEGAHTTRPLFRITHISVSYPTVVGRGIKKVVVCVFLGSRYNSNKRLLEGLQNENTKRKKTAAACNAMKERHHCVHSFLHWWGDVLGTVNTQVVRGSRTFQQLEKNNGVALVLANKGRVLLGFWGNLRTGGIISLVLA